MKYKAIKTKAKDLKAGDLFSNIGQIYWNKENIKAHKSIAEKVYIRTEEPCPENQEEDIIYKIEIIN